jgi:hypothetical protein
MNYVIFSETDAAILYSISRPPMRLSTLIWYYKFINRFAPPPHTRVESCLSKAYQAGILTVSGKSEFRVRVDDDRYEKIHQFDESAANEIEAMLRFEEVVLCSVEWPIVNAVSIVLTVEDYQRAVKDAEREAGRPFF